MFSRPLAFVLLALGCVTAAAGGAYVATRHNTTDSVTTASVPAAANPQAADSRVEAQPASRPVAETEAVVTSAKAPAPAAKSPKAEAEAPSQSRRADATVQKPAAPKAAGRLGNEPAGARTVPATAGAAPVALPQAEAQAPPVQALAPAPEVPKPAEPQPEPPRVPQFEEVILPSSSVIGLQLETSLSPSVRASRIASRRACRATSWRPDASRFRRAPA